MALYLFKPWLINLIPAFPLLGFLINSSFSLVGARRGKSFSEGLPALVGCILPMVSFAIALLTFFVLKSTPVNVIPAPNLFSWIATDLFTVNFSFAVDHLSSVMILIITGVGSLIHLYSVGYMKGDSGFARYFSYLNLFLFFMLLLVLGENLLVLFVGWEGVGLCSYLLIGFWFSDPAKAAAGKKAFIVNRIGDFGFLIGIFLILYAFFSQSQSTDTNFLSFSFMAAHQQIFAPLATIITLALFFGATGKSAQIPLYIWLPDAMAGPTPVSALIHAATMVTAGVYMVARLHFLFALSPFTQHVIAAVGLATAFMAALIGLTQYDIKKVLAYSTVSQLGFMFLAIGAGSPPTAVFHLMTHAFFKACLFLGAGSVIHAAHDQDIRNMGGFFRKMPITAITFLISTLAIAGVPPLAGFFSKDEILLWTYCDAPSKIYYWLAVLTAGLTAFYMFRLFTYTFLGKTRHPHPEHLHESPVVMTIPLMVLALLAIFGGFVGVPEILGGENQIGHWLSSYSFLIDEPFEISLAEMWRVMAISTLFPLCMGILSVILYSRNLNWAKNLKSRLGIFYRLVSDKFRVDEIYDFLFVRPLVFISRNLLWKGIDEKLVDGLMVHGGPSMATFSARMLSLLQSGVLGSYLVYLWLGLVVFLVMAVR